MNIFEKMKINLLKKKIEVRKTECFNNGKFSLFHASFSKKLLDGKGDYKALMQLYSIIDEWDKECKLPYDIGMWLDNLTFTNTVLIHRTNLAFDQNSIGLEYNSILKNIMEEGLINNGHGITQLKEAPDLTLTMTSLQGLAGFINLIASYKNNDTTVIAVFPNNLVDDSAHIINNQFNEIYDKYDEMYKLKPKYIVGAIIKKENGLDEFYSKEEIINKYNHTK